MICCYDLFMAWFCCYDFDMVSVMIFDVGQTCDLKPTHRNHIKTVSKSYQNRNKTHIEIITPNSKHIKFISSNRIQNHIKVVKKIFPEFSILEGFRAYNS